MEYFSLEFSYRQTYTYRDTIVQDKEKKTRQKDRHREKKKVLHIHETERDRKKILALNNIQFNLSLT